MRAVVIVCFIHFGTSVWAESSWPQAVFDLDPQVSPAGSLVVNIREKDVGNEGGDCVIFNTLVDDDGQTPSYVEPDGVAMKTIRWVWSDGAISYLTIEESQREAAKICAQLDQTVLAEA